MIKQKVVIIYHANCTDGTMAAGIAHYFLSIKDGGLVFVEGRHSEVNTDFEDCTIYFLDFSYDAIHTQKLLDSGNKVIVIDHHKTAIKELEGIKCEKYFSYDNSKSGAKLAWEYFSKNEPIIELIEMVSQRDTWKWDQNDSRIKNCLAYLDTLPHTPERFSDILFDITTINQENWYVDAFAKGAAVLAYQDKQVEHILDKHVSYQTFLGYENVAVVNCGLEYSSVVGSYLASKTDASFVVAYQVQPKGIKFSLRSIDSKQDVSVVAKQLASSGGGHRNAAGAFVSISFLLEDLLQLEKS